MNSTSHRFASRSPAATALGVVASILSFGCDSSPRHSTPEAAFEAAKAAFDAGDFADACKSLTPELVDRMAAECLGGLAMMTGMGELPGGEAIAATARSVLKDDGIEVDRVRELMESSDSLEGIRSLIDDRAGFVARAYDCLSKLDRLGGSAESTSILHDTTLEDVAVAGDHATGKLRRPGQSERVPFEKIDGGWRLGGAWVAPASVSAQGSAESPKWPPSPKKGEAPVAVEYLRLVSDPFGDKKALVRLFNFSDRRVTSLAVNLDFLDASGARLESSPWSCISPSVVGPRGHTDMDVGSFLPEKTFFARVRVTHLAFDDGGEWDERGG